MSKLITINGRVFVVQAFRKNVWFGISDTTEKVKYNEEIGYLTFNVASKKIEHGGKDTEFSADFIKKINFESVSNEVHSLFLTEQKND